MMRSLAWVSRRESVRFQIELVDTSTKPHRHRSKVGRCRDRQQNQLGRHVHSSLRKRRNTLCAATCSTIEGSIDSRIAELPIAGTMKEAPSTASAIAFRDVASSLTLSLLRRAASRLLASEVRQSSSSPMSHPLPPCTSGHIEVESKAPRVNLCRLRG